jgi:Tol biopolymer transport system component
MVEFPGDYSPDGTQLVFLRTTDEAPGTHFIIDVAGGGDPRAVSEQKFEDEGRFSPDGESLLTAANGQIMVIGLDGSERYVIDEPGKWLFGAVWSPDGEWIAYSESTSDFRADIIVSRPDGSDRWQVTDTRANEIVVEWGPEP